MSASSKVLWIDIDPPFKAEISARKRMLHEILSSRQKRTARPVARSSMEKRRFPLAHTRFSVLFPV